MGLLDSLGAGIQGLLGNPDVRNSLLTSLAVTGPNSEERMALLMRQKAIQEEAKKAEELRQLQLEAYRRQMAQEDKLQQKDDITGAMIQSMNAQVADAVSRLRSSLSSNDMAGAQKARDELAALQSPEAQQIYRGHVATQGNPEMAMQAGLISPLQSTTMTPRDQIALAEKFTPESVRAYQESGDPSTLRPRQDAAQSQLFAPQFFRGPDGRWVAVQGSNQGGLRQEPLPPGFEPTNSPMYAPAVTKLVEKATNDSIAAGNKLLSIQDARAQLQAIPDEEWRSGFQGTMAEAWKRNFGGMDAQSYAKTQYVDLRNTGVLNRLPPGAASDSDIQLVMAGVPPENAPKEILVRYIAGLEKIAQIEAQEANFRVDYLSQNPVRGLVGYQDAWRDAQRQFMQPAPLPNSSPAQGSRDLSTYSEEELRAELERIQRGRQ